MRRRFAATTLVAAMAGTALIGIASPSQAAVPSSPIDPVVHVVTTAVGDAGSLLCEVLGNIVTC